MIDQIEGKDTPPSLTEIHERLLNHEAKLLSITPAISSTFLVSANVVQQRTNPNNNRFSNQPRQRNNVNNNLNHNCGPRPYLGKCQLCNVQGHNAHRCPQLQSLQQQVASTPSNPFTPWHPRANLAIGSP